MIIFVFQEDELRKEGGKYAHLNEDLHLMVECFAETVNAYGRIGHALSEIKKYLNPVSNFLCFLCIMHILAVKLFRSFCSGLKKQRHG